MPITHSSTKAELPKYTIHIPNIQPFINTTNEHYPTPQ